MMTAARIATTYLLLWIIFDLKKRHHAVKEKFRINVAA